MNPDDIIRMAREAGFTLQRGEWLFTEMLERFAALVAAAEREECAKVCEVKADEEIGMAYEGIALDCAANIRARKDKQ